MIDSDGPDIGDQKRAEPKAAAPRPRVIGSPLPMGAGRRQPPSLEQKDVRRLGQAPPPGRALSVASATEEPSSGLQRAVSAFRSFLPIVQRILPLLDGNVASAISNLLAPRPNPPQASAPNVDLVPLEDGLTALETQHRELREQVVEQNTSLKRVQDQLEMVREATDRNTLEQQELLEELKSFGNKVKIVVIIALGLVVIGVLLNLFLYLHIQRVLP